MTGQFVTDHVPVWDVAQMQYLYASFSQPSKSKKTGPLYLKAKRRLAMALRIPPQKITMAASSSCKSYIEPRTELEGHETLQSEGSASNPLQVPNKKRKKKVNSTVQRNTNLGEKPTEQAGVKVMEEKKTKAKTSKKGSTEVEKSKAAKVKSTKLNATQTSKEKKTDTKAAGTAKNGNTEVKKTKTAKKKKTKGTVKQVKTGAQQKEKVEAQQVKTAAKKAKTEAKMSKGKKTKSKRKVKKEARMEKALKHERAGERNVSEYINLGTCLSS